MDISKKQILLEKASQLFFKKGYERTSMRDLARAVGIQAPGIYHYFKSKMEILHEINEHSWRKFCENVLNEMKKVQDPEERIKIYIRNMTKFSVSLGPITFLVDDSVSTKYLKNRKVRDGEVFHYLRETLGDLSKIKGRQKIVDPTVAAFSLFNMVAHNYKWYNSRGKISVEELSDLLITQFFRGFYGR